MKKIIIPIIVILVILGVYFLLKDTATKTSNALSTNTPLQTTLSEETVLTEQSVVTYTDSGYSPNMLNIKVGTTIKFVNNSSRSMWTASDMHPSHRDYDNTSLSEHCSNPNNTSFDSCTGIQPSDSWSFKFNKPGTWQYHNHSHPSDYGTVITTE